MKVSIKIPKDNQFVFFQLPICEEELNKYGLSLDDTVQIGDCFDFSCPAVITVNELNYLFERNQYCLEKLGVTANELERKAETIGFFYNFADKLDSFIPLDCFSETDLGEFLVEQGYFGDVDNFLLDCINYRRIGLEALLSPKFVWTTKRIFEIRF